MSEDYRSSAGVDEVTGDLGPLYFANVTIEGTPVDGMVDPGSSATIISFDLFKKIGGKARIPSSALEVPHVTLRDYSQNPIPIGAQVKLTFRWKDNTVTTPLYIRSDQAAKGEPCLLGTNVVMPLGLIVPSKGVEARGGYNASPCAAPPTASSAQVCLVGVQRVPSRCATIVTAKLQAPVTKESPILFEPNNAWTGESESQIEDSLVQPDSEGKIKLVVRNPSPEAKILGDSVHVGSAQPCADPLATPPTSEQLPDEADVKVHVVQS